MHNRSSSPPFTLCLPKAPIFEEGIFILIILCFNLSPAYVAVVVVKRYKFGQDDAGERIQAKINEPDVAERPLKQGFKGSSSRSVDIKIAVVDQLIQSVEDINVCQAKSANDWFIPIL